jgi:hypothetical protein
VGADVWIPSGGPRGLPGRASAARRSLQLTVEDAGQSSPHERGRSTMGSAPARRLGGPGMPGCVSHRHRGALGATEKQMRTLRAAAAGATAKTHGYRCSRRPPPTGADPEQSARYRGRGHRRCRAPILRSLRRRSTALRGIATAGVFCLRCRPPAGARCSNSVRSWLTRCPRHTPADTATAPSLSWSSALTGSRSAPIRPGATRVKERDSASIARSAQFKALGLCE